MAINLSRNTRLWVSTVDTGNNNSNTFEIPIQEGYSLSQAVSSSDISVSEAGPTPIRGSKRFNDSLEPVEWSFSTYITPYVGAAAAGSKVLLVDAILWQALAVKRGATMDFEAGAHVVGDADSFNISFLNNSGHVMTELFLFFKIDNTFYKVKQAQVSSAELSVDIEDIAMISWSGQATEIETLASAPAWVATAVPAGYDVAGVAAGYVPVPTNKKYILNKLTTMTMNAPDIAPSQTALTANYSIPITGASISINNNITFVTPNTLSEVDKPIGSFTGAFEVTGSIDAYLRTSSGATGAVGLPYTSADLLSHMTSATGLAKVANATAVVISLGGIETGKPAFVITMPTLHLAVPNFNIEDVVSTSIEFKAIPNSADLVSGSELSIEARVANP